MPLSIRFYVQINMHWNNQSGKTQLLLVVFISYMYFLAVCLVNYCHFSYCCC